MGTDRLTTYRRLSQIAFILLVFLMPVLNILRIDSDTHELILFGTSWSFGIQPELYADRGASSAFHIALQVFLKGILPWLVFLAVFPLLGYFTGRLFCGWACPEGALFELSDFLTLKLIGRRDLFNAHPNDPPQAKGNRPVYGTIALASALIIPLAGGVALTGYFVAPATIWSQIVNWQFTFGVKAGIIGVAIYMLITSIVVRHVLCRFVCAAGLMQMLFGWLSSRSLRLNMDVSRISACTDCKGCDRACFMKVSPRKNKRDISCVNCGACIVACNKELGRGNGLFHLGLGSGQCSLPEENCKNLQPKTVVQ
ncbi:MAG: 4Fe-4S binding protein [Nitrospirota bacterium]|nr:4Fe-4S binding protein [Nitrospirota bacterium]